MKAKVKIQWSRKLGHLYQIFYGLPGNGSYGYGVTRKQASAKARQNYRVIKNGAHLTKFKEIDWDCIRDCVAILPNGSNEATKGQEKGDL